MSVSRKTRALAKQYWSKMLHCDKIKSKEKIVISSTWHYQIKNDFI